MSKDKTLYFKKGNKFIRYLKSITTKKGNYVVPLPDVLKAMGGIDLHASDHGKLQHLKSRKLGFLKNLKDIKSILKEEDKTKFSKKIKMNLIKLEDFKEIFSVKEEDGKSYLDADLIEGTLKEKNKVFLTKTDKIPKNFLGFFIHNNLPYFFFVNKLYSINSENFI